MKKSLISVIIPVYNVEEYLENCIQSVLNQTYTYIEVVMVDDGSTDRSGVLCDKIAESDKRVVVLHKENGGLSSARNSGLENSIGEFVFFVDSDDSIDVNTLKTMVDAQQSKDYDLVICGHQNVDRDEDINEYSGEIIQYKELSYDDIWEEVFGKLNNAVWNKMYKRELIGNLRFQDQIIHGEDLLFNLAYIKRCNLALSVSFPFYHYYNRPGSITNSGFSEKRFDEIKVKDKALEIVLKDYPIQGNNAKKYCFRARMNVMRSLYSASLEKEYSRQVSECKKVTREYYLEIAGDLHLKERIEYYLFQISEPVYKWLTGIRDRS